MWASLECQFRLALKMKYVHMNSPVLVPQRPVIGPSSLRVLLSNAMQCYAAKTATYMMQKKSQTKEPRNSVCFQFVCRFNMECYILLICLILLIIIDSKQLCKAEEVDIDVDDSIWAYLEGKF